jgi:hypothetical protein
MTSPLAADLGRLAAPPHAVPYDDVRVALLDAIIAAKAAGRMEQEAWEAAFGGAMRSLRMRLLAEAEAAMLGAAAYSRYPMWRLRTLLPDAEAADTLLHRLLAEGMPLERFEGLADDPSTRRARAAALETSWEGATRVATAENSRWGGAAAQVANWRRPTTPLWAMSAVLLLAAGLIAAWLSGTLPAPYWFRSINDLWWRLWP